MPRPLRQQTLRNTVAWSYDLLPPEVAEVFRRMSVFAAGCDLDALAAVAVTDGGDPGGSDLLESVAELQDLGLITVTEGGGGEPRLGMLEMIREYALERLDQVDDLDGAQRRHAQYYAGSPNGSASTSTAPRYLTSVDQLEADHDNLRAALTWSRQHQRPDRAGGGARTAIGLRLVQAVAPFWYQHGHITEGRRWLEQAIAQAAADDAGAPLARLSALARSAAGRAGRARGGVSAFSNGAWPSGATSATGISRHENSTASASPIATLVTWTPRGPLLEAERRHRPRDR